MLVQLLLTYMLQRNWVTFADKLVNFFLRIWVAPPVEVMQTKPYHDILEEINPDLIICTYDVFGKLLGAYAKEKSIPFYLVITEVAIFTDLAHPDAYHLCYFPETKNAIRSFDFQSTYFSFNLDRNTSFWEQVRYVIKMYQEYILRVGQNSIYRNIDQIHDEHNQAKCLDIGPIVEPKYYEPLNQVEARTQLALPSQPILLIISGSIGGSFIEEMVGIFQSRNQGPLSILAVCGTDKQAVKKLETIRHNNPNINLQVFGFVKNLEALYAATDVVLARPSAGVLLESLMIRRPIILPAKVTSNDAGQVELVKRHQLGAVYTHDQQAPDLFQDIISNYQLYRNNIDCLLAPYPKTYEELRAVMRNIILTEAIYQSHLK